MGFFKIFSDFFESLFSHPSSSDSKNRSELKKIENDLKSLSLPIYKNGFLLDGIAEGFYLLYKNTPPIEEILASTICQEDSHRAISYCNRLIMTGFAADSRKILEELSYEKRKTAIKEAKEDSHIYEEQEKKLEQILKIVRQPEFTQINVVIAKLMQLYDICRFNYFSALKMFIPDFSSEMNIENVVIKSVPINNMETMFMDMYYVFNNFQITNTMAKAIIALDSLRVGYAAVDQDAIFNHLKKISYALRHIFSTSTLSKLICLSKKEINVSLQSAEYTTNAIPTYVEHLKKQFEVDTQQIKTEIQNEQVSSDINRIFSNEEMEILNGYNTEMNNYLQENGINTFLWVTPMQVLKSFLNTYLNEKIKILLNDIVVEGYFNNPAYKTEFSNTVFSALEASERLEEFESAFSRGEPYDIAVIRSYVKDSHKDQDFFKKVTQLITEINLHAKKIIQNETTLLFNLSKIINEMMEDSKISSPMNISNIKMLLFSTRNKESTDLLEHKYPNWQIFLDIMRNYAIIGDIG